MPALWINGRFVEGREQCVSAYDAGVQHAIGLFETMRGGLEGGRAWVFGLREHLARLKISALGLGLTRELHEAPLGEAIHAAVVRGGHAQARIRLTLTGGEPRGVEASMAVGGAERDATIIIDVRPATPYPDAMFERGVRACIADAKANPFNPLQGHKTLSYWWRVRELQKAAAKHAAEAILMSVSNHVVGGCVSNVIAVRDGGLVTPIARGEEAQVGGAGALPSPVLPGTTRAWLLDAAVDFGLRIERRMMAIGDILDADEVMLTNSSWGVLPVMSVEQKTIGSGRVGEVTNRLRGAWLGALQAAVYASTSG